MDGIKKLQQIAAKDLGGKPEDYVVANERVSRKGGGAGMTLAKAAQRAIDLGGIFDGHEVPKEINAFTKRSAAALAGQGLMGVARDSYPRDGATLSFTAAFAEVEVDLETGVYKIVDFASVADVGTVIHPAALGGQILGRSILGIGHAIGQKWVYDQKYGVALARRFYGCAAVLNAISAAVGDDVFRRAPVNADGILASLEAGHPMMQPLTAHV